MLRVKGSFLPVVWALLTALVAVGPVSTVHADLTQAEKEDGAYVFEKTERVDLSKGEIISQSIAFIAEKLVSARSVIRLQDPEMGKIVGDVVLMNAKAGDFDAFEGIRTRLVLDAKDGSYRLQMSNIEAVDGYGVISPLGRLEGAYRYRIEPIANAVMAKFSDELTAYLSRVKAGENW